MKDNQIFPVPNGAGSDPGMSINSFKAYAHESRGIELDLRRESILSTITTVNPAKSALCCALNIATKSGRQLQLYRVLLVSLLPAVILIIQSAVSLNNIVQTVQNHNKIKGNILVSVETGNLVHRLQIERGTTALFVSSGGSELVGTKLRTILYNLTDLSKDGISIWPTSIKGTLEHFQSSEKLHNYIQTHRQNLNANTTTIKAEIQFYTAIIDQIIDWVAFAVQHARTGDLWRTLVAYHLLIIAKEQAGIERALGSTFFARGVFPHVDMLWYEDKRILGITYLKSSILYSATVQTMLKDNFEGTQLDFRLQRMRSEITKNNGGVGSVQMGTWWFDNMTLYINILKRIQDTLATETFDILDQELSAANRQVALSVTVTVIVICLLPLIAVLVSKLLNAIFQFALALQDKTKALDVERKRTEFLLHQMLPVSVAKRLISNGSVPPESYECVTIYFSDIVGFTSICSRSSSMEVVTMLNLLYEMFDNKVESYDVYKVETIGDAYMVVSGLPERNGNRHFSEIGLLALDLQSSVPSLRIPHLPETQLQLRIGIHSGPCVAGVVGHKMPRYCLFGDTVNTASRMESHGLPRYIHISEITYSALLEMGGFKMAKRGVIEVKGKGQMTTYWLEGVTVDAKSPVKETSQTVIMDLRL